MKKNIVDYFMKVIMSLEGGYSNDPLDKGGPTKHGVTLAMAQRAKLEKDGRPMITAEDVKLLTESDARFVVDQLIVTEDVANLPVDAAFIVADWKWAAGVTGKSLALPVAQYMAEKHPSTASLMLNIMKAQHHRNSSLVIPTNKKFMPGWSKKDKQAGVRSFSGLNINAEYFLRHLRKFL